MMSERIGTGAEIANAPDGSGRNTPPGPADERLKRVLLQVFNQIMPVPLTTFDAQAPIEEVGLDSIGLTQAVFQLEEQLMVELDEASLGQLMDARTLGDFLEVLRTKVAAGA